MEIDNDKFTWNIINNYFKDNKNLLIRHHLDSFNHLLHEVGSGRLLSIVLARRLRGNTDELTESNYKQRIRQSAIKGAEDMMLSYANCCKPLPGDPIVAHTSPGKGLVVHNKSCQNVVGFESELDKYITVAWDMNFMNQYEYSSDLNIQMINHKAGLAKMFNVIAKSNANILDLQTTEMTDHMYSINVTLTVINRVHLSRIMRQIKKLADIKSVKRSNKK